MGGKKKSRPGQAGGASAHLAESSSSHSHHPHASSEEGNNHATKTGLTGSSSDVAIHFSHGKNPRNHDHDHDHDDNDDHSHGHGYDEQNHGHSHGDANLPKSTSLTSLASLDDDEDEGCAHIAANTTACGHTECLSADEKKSESARKTLILVSIFCFTFMCVELVGGYISNSLAIMTDAAHLLSDLASFLISIVAILMARKAPTSSYSFGFHRAEIIGAIISVLLIWVLTGFLIKEAIERIQKPEPIDGRLMFAIATLGLVVNLVMGGILLKSGHGHSHGGIPGGVDHAHSHGHGGDSHGHSHAHGHGHDNDDILKAEAGEHAPLLTSGSTYGTVANGDESTGKSKKNLMDVLHNEDQNINVRAAMIHVIGDAVQSLGVMIAALVIWARPDWSIADPICTFVFSIIVMFTTIRILKDGFRVLMEGVPAHIDRSEVIRELKSLPGVLRVHELHIWSLSMGNTALSVHLLTESDGKALLSKANAMLDSRFGISHTTIQVESLTDDESICGPMPKRGCVRESGLTLSHTNSHNSNSDSKNYIDADSYGVRSNANASY